ncbi:MAG: HAMP domain-containing protein [Calditrichaeota bacterium]|nr:MAG: HAMP domain-containing protein [Calditrichota bacterium]
MPTKWYTGLRTELSLILSGLVALTIFIVLMIDFHITGQDIEKDLGNQLIRIARTSAISIDGDKHEFLAKTKDVNSTEFIEIRDYLREVKEANYLNTEIYTLIETENPDSLMFLVMTNDESFLGSKYQAEEKIHKNVFKSQKSERSKLYTDEHGEWISATASITNSKGEMVGILQIDYSVDTYHQELVQRILKTATYSISTLILAIFVGILLSKRIIAPISEIQLHAQKVAKGNFDLPPLHTNRGDEISELAESFNKMKDDLVEFRQNLLKQKDEIAKQSYLLNSVFSASKEYGILALDSKDKIILCNDAFSLISGYSNQNLLSKPFFELFENREEFEKILFEAKQNINFDTEFPFKKINGEEITLLLAFAPTPRMDISTEARLIVIVQNISKQKEMELEIQRYTDELEELVKERTAKLFESESKIRSIIENASDAIFTFYPISGEILVNNGKLNEFAKKDNIENFYTVLDKETSEKIRSLALNKLIDNEKSFIEEINFINDDKSLTAVRLSGRVTKTTDSKSEESSVVECVGIDISKEKQIEKLKEDLSGMIVHDLRSPLTAIKGGFDLLKVMYASDEKISKITKTGTFAVQKLISMMDDLLYITKYESGKIELEKKEISLNELMKECVNLHKPIAEREKKFVELTPLETEVKILADSNKVFRVFANLISNAIKFSPTDSTVIVSAELADEKVKLKIQDKGEGIPEHYIDKVFDKFTQVKSRKLGRSMGTGLGLTFCKMVMEAHEEEIWVESTLGKGSTFIFTLPTTNA